jgi:hypothetical protein
MAAAWTACTKNCRDFLAWWNPGAIRGFAVFTGVFEGSYGKTGVRNWFLCGQDVVKRMAKMGSGMLDFESRKFCRIPSYFFGRFLRTLPFPAVLSKIHGFVIRRVSLRALDWRL